MIMAENEMPRADSNRQLAIAAEKRAAAAARASGAKRKTAPKDDADGDAKGAVEAKDDVKDDVKAARQKPPEGRSSRPTAKA